MGKEAKDMSHSITISGNTVEEFKAAFGQFAKQFGYVSMADLQAAAAKAAAGKAQPEQTADTQPTEKTEPAKRLGRKPKAETQAQPEAEKQVDLEEAIAEKNAVALTVDDVKAAMREVVGKFGTEACQALLTEFGAKRASDVPDDKRHAFIAACANKVAGK
jgi:hypothetical protein